MSAFTETDKGAGNVLHLYTDQGFGQSVCDVGIRRIDGKGFKPFELHTVD